jgi:hypothetical protein
MGGLQGRPFLYLAVFLSNSCHLEIVAARLYGVLPPAKHALPVLHEIGKNPSALIDAAFTVVVKLALPSWNKSNYGLEHRTARGDGQPATSRRDGGQ